MLYAEYDTEGRIIRLTLSPGPQSRPILATDPAVADFLQRSGDGTPTEALLELTDPGIARVTEDLIALLVDKGLLLITELPEAAQAKLIERRRLRGKLGDETPVLTDDDIL